MASKRQELANMRAQMYNNLQSVKENYASYTPLQKAYFVQKAFNDVNSYCCKMWNMKASDTAFGFMIGKPGFSALAGNNKTDGPYVAYNLKNAFVNENPFKVYQTLFHEMKHIHQSVALTPGNSFGVLYPASFHKHQTSARWLASPRETESDDFSFKEMAKVAKVGMLKSDTRVEACKQTEFFKQARVNSFVKHLKGVGQAAVEAFKSLFGSKFKPTEEQFVNREIHGGARYLNFGTVAEVIKGLPYELKHYTQLEGTPFRDFVNARGDVQFKDFNYFGTSREFNKEANKVAAENYEKGDMFNLTNSQRDRLANAKEQDVERDNFLRRQFELKHKTNRVAANREKFENNVNTKEAAKVSAFNAQQSVQNNSQDAIIQNLSNAINNLREQSSDSQLSNSQESNNQNLNNLQEENEQSVVEQKAEDKELTQQEGGNPALKDEILQHITQQREEGISQQSGVAEQVAQTAAEAPAVEAPVAEAPAMEMN